MSIQRHYEPQKFQTLECLIPWRAVSSATWLRSTNIPSRFISSISDFPRGLDANKL